MRGTTGWAPRRNWLSSALIALALTLASIGAIAPPAKADSSGYVLASGWDLTTGNGRTVLRMQADGNLVLYRDGTPVFASATNQPGSTMRWQGDGNLVIYNANGIALWSTQTNGFVGATLHLQNDGNFVIYGVDGVAIWSAWEYEKFKNRRTVAYSEKYVNLGCQDLLIRCVPKGGLETEVEATYNGKKPRVLRDYLATVPGQVCNTRVDWNFKDDRGTTYYQIERPTKPNCGPGRQSVELNPGLILWRTGSVCATVYQSEGGPDSTCHAIYF